MLSSVIFPPFARGVQPSWFSNYAYKVHPVFAHYLHLSSHWGKHGQCLDMFGGHGWLSHCIYAFKLPIYRTCNHESSRQTEVKTKAGIRRRLTHSLPDDDLRQQITRTQAPAAHRYEQSTIGLNAFMAGHIALCYINNCLSKRRCSDGTIYFLNLDVSI